MRRSESVNTTGIYSAILQKTNNPNYAKPLTVFPEINPTHMPRRANTYATVRNKILMSLHSDQLATYR
jgi:hypothetical protein